jgi:hypothetical protein
LSRPVASGQRLAFSGVRVESRGETVLDAAPLLDPTPGLVVLGRFVETGPDAAPLGVRPFAARTNVHPLVGWHVRGPTSVLLELQANTPGAYRADGVRLAYHVGPRHYVATYDVAVTFTVGS